MRVMLVHNADAGDAGHSRESLVALIRQHGHDVDCAATTDDWRSAVTSSVELIVAAGGDGTVADVARHIAGSSALLGVLPHGTANNLAHALGIAHLSIPDLVSGWARGTRRPFDAGHANGPGRAFRFVESAGVGLIAESIAEISEGNAKYVDRLEGVDARMDAAVDVLRDTLRRLEPIRVELALDGEPVSGDYLLLEIMNFGLVGPRLCLIPEAASADGFFDVVLAEERHRAQLMDDLPNYRPGLRPSGSLPVHRARHVTLTCPNARLHLDDQLRRCQGPIELTAERHAFTFLV